MRERHVIICDIVEEVDLLFLEHKRSGNRMHRSVTPAFVEEATGMVKRIEVVHISRGTQPVKVTNLEVGPLCDVSKLLREENRNWGYERNGNDCKSFHHHH